MALVWRYGVLGALEGVTAIRAFLDGADHALARTSAVALVWRPLNSIKNFKNILQ